MENKVKLDFTIPEQVIVKYNDAEIKVTPFLTTAQQIFLINKYTEEYFEKETSGFIENSEYEYLNAEYTLVNYIFQLVTNIDTETLDNDFYSDAVFIASITSCITNYFDFRNKLNFIINEIKQQNALKSSVGNVLEGLVEKAYGIMDKISDISPEEIEKAKESGLELLKKLEDSSVIKSIK